MKTVYLVRHAETTWNLEGKVQGSQDTDLSTDGLAQTVKTVAFLSTLQFDTILTSPLARARAIAEPVGVNLGILPIVMPELREIEFGSWEGHNWDEIGTMYPTT
ncbi:MAG TPA: histidine phosphatase family protein, partial [Clostridia bacterium]|nr:histidine phosphatase family protein [Clostridia bacterium]